MAKLFVENIRLEGTVEELLAFIEGLNKQQQKAERRVAEVTPQEPQLNGYVDMLVYVKRKKHDSLLALFEVGQDATILSIDPKNKRYPYTIVGSNGFKGYADESELELLF